MRSLLETLRSLFSRLASALRDAPRRLDARLDGFLGRRPRFTAYLARYGALVFLLIGGVFVVAAAAAPEGRGQQLVYASGEGEVLAASPEPGVEPLPVFEPAEGELAAAPLLNGGSRSLSFTVLRGEGEGDLRGDLYGADLVRGTVAQIQSADPGEAFLFGGYSYDRSWLMAERFSAEEPPNAAIFTASGATRRYVEPEGEDGAAAVIGAAWGAQNSLYAWLSSGEGEGAASLTAYNFFERRQAVVYRTENRVGLASYNFESNTAVFDERPPGAPLSKSRLVALSGTNRMPVEGADGLGLYDPSLPVPNLDYGMAVLWTDGERTGVGVFDPATWTFRETGVLVEAGSRYPQVSYDGALVATLDEAGTTLTVRRMEDGEVVRRIEGVQPPEVALDRLREGGIRIPDSAYASAPAPYSWRSFADS